MHGLETLTQLLDVRAGHGAPRTIPSAPVSISDRPRFPFRGLMIDSGRHFLSVDAVKRAVNAAAMAKLNVIHWHLVDAQSFATCSKTYPLLCTGGAYPNNISAAQGDSPSTGVPKASYSPEDLAGVVAFAKTRGVRIQPEWDVPGHGAWGMGMPDLVTSECANALDVTKPSLYAFLRAFLTEMGGIFTEPYLFLGGDELSVSCFDNSPSVVRNERREWTCTRQT